jgi:hypothetical protein
MGQSVVRVFLKKYLLQAIILAALTGAAVGWLKGQDYGRPIQKTARHRPLQTTARQHHSEPEPYLRNRDSGAAGAGGISSPGDGRRRRSSVATSR